MKRSQANENIPDELYFVPRNLGIKAEIMARLGDTKASNELYEKSADLLDALLSKVPTPTAERQLLNDLSIVYAGYFVSLSDQGRTEDAFRAIERARGRVEAQGLSHHEIILPHEPDAAEQNLTKLNIQLLNTDDAATRAHILEAIYSTEQQLGTDPIVERSAASARRTARTSTQSAAHLSCLSSMCLMIRTPMRSP